MKCPVRSIFHLDLVPAVRILSPVPVEVSYLHLNMTVCRKWDPATTLWKKKPIHSKSIVAAGKARLTRSLLICPTIDKLHSSVKSSLPQLYHLGRCLPHLPEARQIPRLLRAVYNVITLPKRPIHQAKFLGEKQNIFSHSNVASHFIHRRGIVYRGIYLPSLSGKLQDERLEFAYLRYAHRQRQKSLMLVNSADIMLKILIVLRVFCHDENNHALVQDENVPAFLGGIAAACLLNITLGLISWWRCYANNYLHWGALVTWCLLLGNASVIFSSPCFVHILLLL